MSAAQWRKAMNSAAGSQTVLPAAESGNASQPRKVQFAGTSTNDAKAQTWSALSAIQPRHWLTLALLLLFPFVATPFFTFQIGAQTLVFGLIALSLTFLAGYGGMVSLSQMTVAGIAGYMTAIFGLSGSPEISLNWPWWLTILTALTLATIAAALIGWLSVRTEGIYTIMITLAVGVAFFYFAQQNYAAFNGFQGFQKVMPPALFGVQWRDPLPFYFLSLFCALAGYFFVKYLVRSPFGIALQGVRDNPRRMNALGFNVTAHRIAAHAVGGLIAAVGGVLLVWYNGLITPGTVNSTSMINILIIAVVGGMRRPIGAFIGALIFVLLQNFAVDLFSRERFNLVIGGVFLLIVLFSPDGVLGFWEKMKARMAGRRTGSGMR
ncbi:MAG: hypothetical protein JWQ23_289 [Herminiimonas sp.]|nr:hypothetical protein [Herminiimonas sp.]